MITLEQAKNLKLGQTVYHVTNKNADGSKQRWRINGKVKTWKRSPEKVQIPIKHGLYSNDYITEQNLNFISIEE